MVSETLCKYNQFGYCKLQDECNNLHVNDVCRVSDCRISNCNLRHPRPCKYHAANGFCKFGSSCRYTHKQDPTEEIRSIKSSIEEISKRIENFDRILLQIHFQVTGGDHSTQEEQHLDNAR